MRKFTLIALIALCFALPGKVLASTNSYSCQVENTSANGEISPELVEKILKYVAVEYGYDFHCLCNANENGFVEISKVANGYQIEINDGGTGVILVIEDI